MIDRQDYWNQRAALGNKAGTQDYWLTQLEQDVIQQHCSDGMHVLDAGCGTGEMLHRLARQIQGGITGVGLDFAEDLLATRRHENDDCLTFRSGDITTCDLGGPYDLIYTQRLLINLPDWETQQCVILRLGEALKPGGCLLCVESSQDGLDNLNTWRDWFGLPQIIPPAVNRYLRAAEMASVPWPSALKDPPVDFTSAYYLMSRIVNASVAKKEYREPRYDSPINAVGRSFAWYLAPKEMRTLAAGIGQTWYWRFGR